MKEKISQTCGCCNIKFCKCLQEPQKIKHYKTTFEALRTVLTVIGLILQIVILLHVI